MLINKEKSNRSMSAWIKQHVIPDCKKCASK